MLCEGEITIKNYDLPIPYMVFEFADDMAKNLLSDVTKEASTASSLMCLHESFVAVKQLHNHGIAHQDIKPSNLLLIDNRTKIGDLGRSSQKGKEAVHDNYCVAGAVPYSPPELIYSQVSPNWETRRVACDMYMLGGMIVFYYTGEPLTAIILNKLEPELHPAKVRCDFEQVLPSLYSTMNNIYADIESKISHEYREELMSIIKQLTDPDPMKRGFPKYIGQENQYNLDPYISKLGMISRKAKYVLDKTIQNV